MTRAGLPAAITLLGKSPVTTDRVPTTVLSPMLTPLQTVTPSPSQTLFPIDTGFVVPMV